MKNLQNILPILLLLSCTSCGVFSKFAKHAKHEAHQVDSASSTVAITNDLTIKGDSIVNIPGSSLQVVMPFTLDTLCTDHFDSIVSDNVKVYLKPLYQVNADGVKTIKGMQVKAITPGKIIRPGFTLVQHSSINMQATAHAIKDSASSEKTIIKKHDNRLGGYTTIIIIISLLCVGWYIVKTLKIKI